MKKSNKIIGISLFAFSLIIAILIIYNLNNVSDNKDSLSLYVNDEEAIVYTSQQILEINQVQDITLTQNKNGKPSVDRNVTVIELKELLDDAKIDLNEVKSVEVLALDGFSASYEISEVLKDDFIYIMLLEDNMPLPIEDGNFSMAVPSDEDSTRWMRQVYKIEVIC